jgi:hypothetical protein
VKDGKKSTSVITDKVRLSKKAQQFTDNSNFCKLQADYAENKKIKINKYV